jgi:hypothetical protein
MTLPPPEFHPAKIQQDYVSDRSAAVVLRARSGRFGIGSATAIQIDGRLFIATAAHVLKDVTGDVDLHIVPSGFSTQRLVAVKRGLSADGGHGFPDVAWVEIDPGSAVGCHIAFLGLDDLGVDKAHDSSRAFLIQGYPYSEVGQEELPKLDFLSIGAMTLSRGEDSLAPEVRDGKSMILEYPPHDYHSTDFPAPPAPGISGGGVWRIGQFDDGQVWDPSQAKLVAINREWRRRDGLLFATPIRFWLETLATAHPELATSIRARLGG